MKEEVGEGRYVQGGGHVGVFHDRYEGQASLKASLTASSAPCLVASSASPFSAASPLLQVGEITVAPI